MLLESFLISFLPLATSAGLSGPVASVGRLLPAANAGQAAASVTAPVAPAAASAASEVATARSADELVAAIEQDELAAVVREVLARNPDVARARARARAARQRAPQVRALPDPTAQVTAFLESPETRVGPQEVGVGVMQGIPWLSKLSLKERAALLAAEALEADVEARRLKLVTEVRRIAYELAFLARFREITEAFLEHLVQHEEIARARYSTGVGLGQDVIKLQAEITKVQTSLLDIDTREESLAARLNRLRDRPASEPLPRFVLPEDHESELDDETLFQRALGARPEVAAADLEIERGETLVELARKGYKPDFRAGLTYTLVGGREDAPGRANPPPDNGQDVLGVQFGVSIPIWRKKLKAGVEEALEMRSLAEEGKRDLLAEIRGQIGDLAQRIPLSFQQLQLVEDLLVAQAEEALESVKSAYVASTVNALDLLDAEHVLFNAETAAARARADWAIAVARLEGAVAESFSKLTSREADR